MSAAGDPAGRGPAGADRAADRHGEGDRADRAAARYRRLRSLFPPAWRERHEGELVETLREVAREDGIGALAGTIDLLRLALVLRARALAERAARTRRPSVLRGFAPAACAFAFALLLALPVLVAGQDVPPEFVASSLLLVAVPGVGVLYTVASALAGGRDRGLVAAIGCTLGIVPHLVVAALGLSGLMQLGALVFETVRWAGVAYLVWMGLGMIRHGGGLRLDGIAATETATRDRAGGAATPGTIVRRGVLVNLLNPKLTLFFFAFLPQFLDAPDAVASGAAAALDPRLFVFGSLFMLLTLAGFSLYAVAGAALRRLALGAPSLLDWLQRAFGALLLGFAARLAASER